MEFRKKRLGGRGREWSMLWSISPIDLDNSLSRTARGTVSFRAQTADEAMLILLQFVQKTFAKTADMHKKLFRGIALPHQSENGGITQATEMIRLKQRYDTGQRILRIKNPRKAFVQGYGPNALTQLGFN